MRSKRRSSNSAASGAEVAGRGPRSWIFKRIHGTRTDEDLSRITVGDCEQFLRGRYTPDHTLLTIVGDFDPGEASEALRRWFEPLRGRGVRTTTVAEPAPSGGLRASALRASAHGDLTVPVLIVGWRAPAGAAGDAPALDVLSVLLSGKSAGRLNRRLVSGEQTSRFAQTGRDGRRDGTMFWAAAAPRSERDTATVERALVGEIELQRVARANERAPLLPPPWTETPSAAAPGEGAQGAAR